MTYILTRPSFVLASLFFGLGNAAVQAAKDEGPDLKPQTVRSNAAWREDSNGIELTTFGESSYRTYFTQRGLGLFSGLTPPSFVFSRTRFQEMAERAPQESAQKKKQVYFALVGQEATGFVRADDPLGTKYSAGDCGFYVLGITREAGVALLLEKLGDQTLRSMVAQEVKNAIGSVFIPRSLAETPEYQSLQRKLGNIAASKTKLTQRLNDKQRALSDDPELAGLSIDDLINIEPPHPDMEKDLEALRAIANADEEAKDGYAAQEHVIRTYLIDHLQKPAYITAGGGDNWLHHAPDHMTIFNALAYALGVELQIWQEAPNDVSGKLSLHYSYKPESAKGDQIFHILYNGSHYARLERVAVPGPEEASSQQSDATETLPSPRAAISTPIIWTESVTQEDSDPAMGALEETLHTFDRQIIERLEVKKDTVEDVRCFLVRRLAQLSEGEKKAALVDLLGPKKNKLRRPQSLIQEVDKPDLENAEGLTSQDQKFGSINARLTELEKALSAFSDDATVSPYLEELRDVYQSFLNKFVGGSKEKRRDMLQDSVSLNTQQGAYLASQAMVHEMRGDDLYWGRTEGVLNEKGSHMTRRFGDYYLKYAAPGSATTAYLAVEPLVERSLFGLYHFIFGANAALAPATLLHLQGISVRKAKAPEDQKKIDKALRLDSLFNNPDEEFLKQILHILMKARSHRAILQNILGDRPLKKKSEINSLVKKDGQLLLRNLRGQLANENIKNQLRRVWKEKSKEPLLEDVLTDLTDNAPDALIKDKQDALLQANQMVVGRALEAVNDQDTLDKETFAIHVLGSLIAHGGDNKGDNLIACGEGEKVVGIDNDIVYGPIFQKEGKSYRIRLRNMLYFMKGMKDRIPESIEMRLKNMSPETIILNWLYFIERENQRYQHLEQKIDKKFLEPFQKDLGDAPMSFPLRLSPDIVTEIYASLQKLKGLMNRRINLTTLQDAFHELQPAAAAIYEKIFEKAKGNPQKATVMLYERTLGSVLTEKTFLNICGDVRSQRPLRDILRESKTNYEPPRPISEVLKWFVEQCFDIKIIGKQEPNRDARVARLGQFFERLHDISPKFYEAYPQEWQASLQEAMEARLSQTIDFHPLYKYLIEQKKVSIPTKVATRYYQKIKQKDLLQDPSHEQTIKIMMSRSREFKFKVGLDALFTPEKTKYPVSSESNGCGYLTEASYRQLFKEDRTVREYSQKGRRQGSVLTTPLGVKFYVKFLPEMPGREEQVGALSRMLFQRGTPYTELVRLNFVGKILVDREKGEIKDMASVPVLLTEFIEGDTIGDVQDQEIFDKINPTQFGEVFLLSLLTNPEDGNKDNYILEPQEDGTYHIVPIDNDRTFVPILARELVQGVNGERIKVQVKSILYCMSQLNIPLDKTVVERFLQLDAGPFLTSWLDRMEAKEKKYMGLFPSGPENNKHLFDLVTNYKVFIGVPHPKGSILSLYDKFTKLQRLLRGNTRLPMIRILESMEKNLWKRYNPVLNLPISLRERYAKTGETHCSVSTTHQTMAASGIPMKADMFDSAVRADRTPGQAKAELEEAIQLATQRIDREVKNIENRIKRLAPSDVSKLLQEEDFSKFNLQQQRSLLITLGQKKDVEYLKLKNASALTSAPNPLGDVFLTNIKSLSLEGPSACDEGLFNQLHRLQQQAVGGLQLTSLKLKGVKKLKGLCTRRIFGRNLPLCLPSLEELSIKKCPDFQELRLEAPLTKLIAEDCPKFGVLEILGHGLKPECISLENVGKGVERFLTREMILAEINELSQGEQDDIMEYDLTATFDSIKGRPWYELTNEGYRLVNGGEFKLGMVYYLASVLKNSRDELPYNNTGFMYQFYFTDLPHHLSKAVFFYQLGSLYQAPWASYALGFMYDLGIGTYHRQKRAQALINRAAKQEHQGAIYHQLTFETEGTRPWKTQDEEKKALRLLAGADITFEETADGRAPKIVQNMGVSFSEFNELKKGLVCEYYRNPAKALGHYKAAAWQGNKLAQFFYRKATYTKLWKSIHPKTQTPSIQKQVDPLMELIALMNRMGVTQDIFPPQLQQEQQMFQQNDQRNAFLWEVNLVREAQGKLRPESLKKAKEAGEGDPNMLLALAGAYLDGLGEFDKGSQAAVNEALKHIKAAAKQGSTPALAVFVYLFEAAQIDTQAALVKSHGLLQEAAQAGDAEANYTLGMRHWYGAGIERNKQQALRYLIKARVLGKESAGHAVSVLAAERLEDKKKLEPERLAALKERAQAGEAEASFLLSFIYADGLGEVEQDSPLALTTSVDHMVAAGAKGLPGLQKVLFPTARRPLSLDELPQYMRNAARQRANFLLGARFMLDMGTYELDEKLAMAYFQKAVDLGKEDGGGPMFLLESFLTFKNGKEQDPEVLTELKKLADLVDETAWLLLEQVYDAEIVDLAKGAPETKKEYIKFLIKMAERGVATAQVNLGWAFETGQGVDQDYAKAFEWTKKAADQGAAVGQSNLGEMYEFGRHVQVDYAQALSWYEKSAAQSCHGGQENLGRLYLQGRGVKKDEEKGYALWEKAARAGRPRLPYALGVARWNGRRYAGADELPEVRERAAWAWYKLAAEAGDERAQFALGFLNLFGLILDASVSNAERWFEKAAENGEPLPACLQEKWEALTKDLNRQGSITNILLAKASEGDLDAQYHLGMLHYEGLAIRPSNEAAIHWIDEAARGGHALAQYRLGILFYEGLILPQDNDQAALWTQRAAEQGHAKAKEAYLSFI